MFFFIKIAQKYSSLRLFFQIGVSILKNEIFVEHVHGFKFYKIDPECVIIFTYHIDIPHSCYIETCENEI